MVSSYLWRFSAVKLFTLTLSLTKAVSSDQAPHIIEVCPRKKKKSENSENTFYDQFYCCTFTMYKNHLILTFAILLKNKKLMGIMQFSVFTWHHQIQTRGLSIIVSILFYEVLQQLNTFVYSYFENDCRKKIRTEQSQKLIWDMIKTLFLAV